MSTSEKLIKYYTDHHDVDEDKMTIINQGGYWSWNEGAGITHRDVNGSSSSSSDVVASLENKD